MASRYEDSFQGRTLSQTDMIVKNIINLEADRQSRRIILIPSESICPAPVREALGSQFQNIYCEGYPPLRMTREEESKVLDFSYQLARYRRYADRRFYKGCDYANFIEVLAQRRAAALFATETIPADQIFVNVQPLSGAAANNCVYEALCKPGDTVMGMSLAHGGHLSHGSPFNRSGKRYNIVSYEVDAKTELLDYNKIADLAKQHRPKMIIAGWTSYPWSPDWKKFREIADSIGAKLLADVSHPAGMIAGGVYPNPLGYADVIMFTTHKTMCGPRGAILMSTDELIAKAIDTAVFPGEQGGPHVNKHAAMAVAFGLAAKPEFKQLMKRIVDNAKVFVTSLQKRGLRVVHGGTDTHLLLIDLKSVPVTTGYRYKGEVAVRLLELCGIVANKNTIPGDNTAADASGIRMGTPWITQRGFGPDEVDRLADLIAQVVKNISPFEYIGLSGRLPRGKIDREILANARKGVADLLVAGAGPGDVYPHSQQIPSSTPVSSGVSAIRVSGERPAALLQGLCTGNIFALKTGGSISTFMLDRKSNLLANVVITRNAKDYTVFCNPADYASLLDWLRGISDGYLFFDDDDITRKVEGPAEIYELLSDEIKTAIASADAAAIEELREGKFKAGAKSVDLLSSSAAKFDLTKLYFVGCAALVKKAPAANKIEFKWVEKEEAPKRTSLYEIHKKTAKKVIPFAGWDMPVWYSSIGEEHRAVREAAGLFDVSHMGVFEVSGENAASFLNAVTSNYASWIEPGQSQYAYLLDQDGCVIDDIMIYRRAWEKYLMVVNASNADKDWTWLNLVNDGKALIDRTCPARTIEAKAVIRNLKDRSSGDEMRVDIALQGPASLKILQKMAANPIKERRLAAIRRTDLCEMDLDGINLVIARTGYTGEDVAFELFVHPDKAESLWNKILEAGSDLGVKPCGLGARDSTRTEAGLPLYGHELEGHYGVSPAGAGFASYVKLHKPFFIGREAYLQKEKARTMEILRFRIAEKGIRMAKTGDAVANRRGVVVGFVTSCAMDLEGQQVGLAYCDKKACVVNEPLSIFCSTGSPTDVAMGQKLKTGGKVLLPVGAVTLTRMRRIKKK